MMVDTIETWNELNEAGKRFIDTLKNGQLRRVLGAEK